MTPDIIFGLGLAATGTGLWLIWPPLAICAFGLLLISTSVGLVLAKRREAP